MKLTFLFSTNRFFLIIRWLHELTGVKTTDLYRTASLVADMRVTQVVNVKKGIHLKFPKAVVEGLRTGSPYETRYPAKKPIEPNTNEEIIEFINGEFLFVIVRAIGLTSCFVSYIQESILKYSRASTRRKCSLRLKPRRPVSVHRSSP